MRPSAHRAHSPNQLLCTPGVTDSLPPSPVQAWPASEENEYGHLRIPDFSDAVSRIPPEEIHGMAGGGLTVGLLVSFVRCLCGATCVPAASRPKRSTAWQAVRPVLLHCCWTTCWAAASSVSALCNAAGCGCPAYARPNQLTIVSQPFHSRSRAAAAGGHGCA